MKTPKSLSGRLAINGFGRIGRLVMRALLSRGEDTGLTVVAINDLSPAENLAYLLKYDSTHGIFPGEVTVKGDKLVVLYEGHRNEILICGEKEPERLPWKDLGVDFVLESTGHFTQYEGAHKHLMAGAHKVVISAPVSGSTSQVPTYVIGVNHENYNPEKDHIVSNASCTTNCLAPLAKVLHEHFGIVEAFMSTIHAVTASQPTVDGPSKKDWRGGRGALQNIIPASTGAAKALGLCMPELSGKITGMSFRVPVADVSVVDLTVRLGRNTTYKEICEQMRNESRGRMKGILKVVEEPLVSSDFIGMPYSTIFDVDAGISLNPTFFKLVAWYDNEMGYSHRIVDLMTYMKSRDH